MQAMKVQCGENAAPRSVYASQALRDAPFCAQSRLEGGLPYQDPSTGYCHRQRQPESE
jgi:hypothetical protein